MRKEIRAENQAGRYVLDHDDLGIPPSGFNIEFCESELLDLWDIEAEDGDEIVFVLSDRKPRDLDNGWIEMAVYEGCYLVMVDSPDYDDDPLEADTGAISDAVAWLLDNGWEHFWVRVEV